MLVAFMSRAVAGTPHFLTRAACCACCSRLSCWPSTGRLSTLAATMCMFGY
ncbi:ORFL279C [Human betaherpesvirus 5]|nr:ORFL279C [Human betaherpesvirus 5]